MSSVYPTICPGCNFGCGLYIRENGKPEVDFRKSSPANSGKLCRFGLRLADAYGQVKASIDGKDTTPEEAAKEAARRISGSKGAVAFLSFGNTTCEELLALNKLAEPYLCTGVDFGALPGDAYDTLSIGIPYADIESAKHIVLFIDPYEQYPLIVRRLLSAKKKGAKITAVWWKDLPIADENKRPKDIGSVALTGDSLVISDFHPLSDAGQVKSILSLAKNAGARVTFLKPFANSTGAYVLAKSIKQRSLSQLAEDINRGAIKTLFCLESDPSVLPEGTLSKLGNIIIQTGRTGAGMRSRANIVIPAEPLYKKKGTLVNNEGRVQALGGDGTVGLDMLGIVAGAKQDFNALHESVKKTFGIAAVDEFTLPKYERKPYGAVQAAASAPAGTKPVLVSVPNPFMWQGLADDNDFVEINLDMVRTLRLLKGGSLKIKSDGSQLEKKFRVAPVAGNVLLATRTFGIEKGTLTEVEVSR